MDSFKQLVRFTANNQAHYGDLLEEDDAFYTVRKLEGDAFIFHETNEIFKVDKLLCPLENTPIIICIGLNYKSHAEEAKLSLPKYPAVFVKPADALAGPFDKIHTHPETREMLDYEGELVIVVGKDCKDVRKEDAASFVLGYTVGNDVSARNFQVPEASGGQFCYAKSFDGFAPIGDRITSCKALPEPLSARIVTKVNGSVKQDSNINDMIFSVGQIISHLSRGTTLRNGTVIMTGTPSGVGYFRKEFLKDGDVVEVSIEGVGRIENVVSFS
ncbi:hypothetical protein K4F52_006408 [Lecanicillium sp. MT-2017a]|nr:hypothetical protein K4F52_006408 [Lecanicillium sp. MT-2017a]